MSQFAAPSQNSNWKPDDKAFIFSLSNRSKHHQVQNKSQAVDHSKDYLVAFGRGHDFRIASNCNNNTESYSNFGYTYQLPEGMGMNSDEAKSYLSGSYQFKVVEIEVYKVVFAPAQPANSIASKVAAGVASKIVTPGVAQTASS